MTDTQARLHQKFYSDPDWALVVEMFTKHLTPLMDMTTIDTTQSAETVKAEVIARSLAFNTLADIVNETEITENKITKVPNPYR
jgi:hypothetical protein